MPLSAAQDFPIWVNSLIFLLASGFIWAAGTRLVRYADRIAATTGLGHAFAGMLLLGVITSLPEIANVATASGTGSPALAVNNLLGSASINVLLLAVVDTFIGRDALTSVPSQSTTMMQAALSMLVLTLVGIAFVLGDVLIWGVGIWSTAICAASIGAFWLSARYEKRAPWIPDDKNREERDRMERPERDDHRLSLLIRNMAVAGGVILVAGYCLSQTGDALAGQTGLGTGLVGFLLIGVATSLPELSTITTALRLRRYEMAIGEVLGTNFVNVSLILLSDLVYTGGAVINEGGRFESISALLGVLLTGILLVGLLERRNLTFWRMGYDSFCVLVAFGGGVALLYTLR